MNLQTNETIDYVTNEDNSEQDFLAFADLELTDEQLSAVKGGPFGCSWCTTIGNHNETSAEDGTEGEADLLDFTDLCLTEEQLAGVKGGPSTNDSRAIKITASTANLAPGQHLNHNETTAEDEATETAGLNDLPVNDDQETEVVGGVGGGITKLGSRRLILQGDGTYS